MSNETTNLPPDISEVEHRMNLLEECLIKFGIGTDGTTPTGKCFLDLKQEVLRLIERNEGLRQDVDHAYKERNHLVAHLARLYPAGIRPTEIEGWDSEWQNCVYVDLPKGQVSYHYHDREKALFEGLPPYKKPFDNHDKHMVHDRLKNWLDSSFPVEMIVARVSNKSPIDPLFHDLIGIGNRLPWPSLPRDMARFKRLTKEGGAVLMGVATALSIGAALPDRVNYVLTHSAKAPYPGQIAVKSAEEAVHLAESTEGVTKLFVIGGNRVYESAFEFFTGMHVTDVILEDDSELKKAPLDSLVRLKPGLVYNLAMVARSSAKVYQRGRWAVIPEPVVEEIEDNGFKTTYASEIWEFSQHDQNELRWNAFDYD